MNFPDFVKKYVDVIVAFGKVLEEAKQIKDQDLASFSKAVAEEKRKRGINEADIENTLQGIAWGQKR
jgi:hypothetical protein